MARPVGRIRFVRLLSTNDTHRIIVLLKPRYLARFRQVAAVFIGHGFDDVLTALDLRRFVPGRHRPRLPASELAQQRAARLRQALEELGTTYIKLGQVLSSRTDMFSRPYIEELSKLQDNVASVEFDAIKEVIESEIGRPLTSIFGQFDQVAVASASVAQVHRARVAAGSEGPRDVAVKVVKPGVEEEIENDLAILREVARVVGRSSLGKRYDVSGFVYQLEQTLRAELDLANEARHAERLGASLSEFPHIRVPRVVGAITRRRVLVVEYIEGRRLSKALGELPEPRPELADELWRAYLKQILIDGAFHCDPHPGNLLLDSRGNIAVLDHGMMAYLARESQLRLMGLLLALAERDGERTAEACVELGVPGQAFRDRAFKGDVGRLVARYSGATLGEIPLGSIVQQLLLLSFRHDIQIPPEFMLLGKTLLNLEPVCRQLDPKMDPVGTMRDMASSVLGRQISRDFNTQRFLAGGLELRSFVNEVPGNLRRLIGKAVSNEIRVGIQLDKAEEMQAAIQKVASRITLGLITAALIVGSALLTNVGGGARLWGYPVFALVGFLLAAGLGLYLIVKIIIGEKY